MREIHFRGMQLNNGVWAYGSLIVFDEDQMFIMPQYNYATSLTYTELFGITSCCVIPETVGQYTGLIDNHGNKIFEGDILKFDYKGENKGVAGIASVIFKDGKFGVLWGWHQEFVALDGFANTTMEVIDNIHDNPQMIKT